jgi:hypothetical protein
MLAERCVLNEIALILLRNRHEHSYDVADEMAAGLRNTVQEQGLRQGFLIETPVVMVELVWL